MWKWLWEYVIVKMILNWENVIVKISVIEKVWKWLKLCNDCNDENDCNCENDLKLRKCNCEILV